ncbi:MAG: AraC family transcriptional regulator, partial [Treponema sp.]|nr:AraC family transcriptional regulator [Treponema sp.]
MDQVPRYEKKPFKITFPFLAWGSDEVAFPPHWHDFFEVLLVTKGGLYVSADDIVYEAVSGDIIMVNSGIIHSFFDTKPDTSVFGLQFSITFFDESFIEFKDIVFKYPVIGKNMIPDTLYANVCRLLREVSREYHEKTKGYQLAIKSKLYELMLVLFRRMPNVEHKIPLTKSRHICDFILKNFDNPDLSLKKAADALNISKFYFAHFFKKHMGYSFHSYLTTTRVNFAKRDLLETKMTITDVAFHS